MSQLSFGEAIGYIRPLQVIDDFGPVGQGVSQSRYVRAENGSEYLIKGPTLCPSLPYAAVNELIAVRLADTLNLPVLDHRILQMGSHLFFGSARMAQDSFYPATNEALFQSCMNRDRIYDVVAFDIWVANIDRHGGNLLVRKISGSSLSSHMSGIPSGNLLILNDHSHCILRPNYGPSDASFLATLAARNCIALNFVALAIRDVDTFRASLAKIESLSSELIQGVVQSVPEEWLPQQEQPEIENFLLMRQQNLRSIVQRDHLVFPHLASVAI